MDMDCVLCDVEIEFLCIVQRNLRLRNVTIFQ